MERKRLKKGVDFYFNENGFMVFTEKYLLERGSCCKSCCKHCPYGYKKSCSTTTTQSNKEINRI